MERIQLDRRTFLRGAAGLGVLSAAGVDASLLTACSPRSGDDSSKEVGLPVTGDAHPVEAAVDLETGEVTINEDVLVRYTACLGCYAACGKRVSIDRASGEVISTGGNPYHPSCAYPNLKFEDSLQEAYLSMSFASGKGNVNRGTSCARGLATWDAYAQPDRITTPLKRAGKRGEGKWRPISWDDLILEVTEGGKLFAELGEDQDVEGFKAVYDTETLIDEESPLLGAKSNQLVILGGRGGDGRTPFNNRFAASFGTANTYGHSSTCGGASYAWAMLESSAVYTYPDLDDAEYVLWMGEFPGANGKSIQSMAKRVIERCQAGECTMDVLDPVLGNGCVTAACKNITWTPIRTQTDAAFALGMIRWMMENDAVNTEYLACPSMEAAQAAGYASFTNAAHLVIADEGHPLCGQLLRAAEAGIPTPEPDPEAEEQPDYLVAVDAVTGKPALALDVAAGDLTFEGEVNGIRVRAAYLMLQDSAFSRSMKEYATITGVDVKTVERIAREFSSHGVKASVGCMGATAGGRGMNAEWAHLLLKAMVGGNQMEGGSMPTYVSAGVSTGPGARYSLAPISEAGKAAAGAGTYISRTGCAFGATDEYARRTAAGEKDPQPRLPWYNVGRISDSQALISMVNGYPYRPKILITWMFNTLQATSGAMRDAVLERLQDPDVIPLHIVCDVVLGEHTLFADYVVPDTNPYESFGIVTQQLDWKGRGDAVRWPVVEPGTIELADGRHASYEAFLIDVAKACGIPGYGENAISDVSGATYSLNDACDYFVRALANLAYAVEDDVVPDIAEDEVHLQGLDALPEAWRAAVTEEEWPKVLNLLSRGGRFWGAEDMADETGRARFGGSQQTFVYAERVAAVASEGTNVAPASGVLAYEPEVLADGTPLFEAFSPQEFPFASTNYKPRFRSVSMLANSPIMRDLCPENYVEVNDGDAEHLGIVDGDIVRVTNPGGDVMEGPAMVRGGIAPGTFGMAYGYGHKGYGAQPIAIEGSDLTQNEAIGAGMHLQTMLDPTVGGLFPLCDPVSAAPARSGGMYKIEKA